MCYDLCQMMTSTDAKCDNWFHMGINIPRVVNVRSLICLIRVVHRCVIEHIQLAVLTTEKSGIVFTVN